MTLTFREKNNISKINKSLSSITPINNFINKYKYRGLPYYHPIYNKANINTCINNNKEDKVDKIVKKYMYNKEFNSFTNTEITSYQTSCYFYFLFGISFGFYLGRRVIK